VQAGRSALNSAIPTRPNGLPPNLLPFLLLECGRPMLIAAAQAPRRLGTIMVAWKDAREPARALHPVDENGTPWKESCASNPTFVR
jgi:hypothetical protein